MRKELKKFDWHIHGLSEKDLEKIIKITKNFIKARKKELEQESDKTRKENPESADDILDDILHYAWVDMQVLWQFCLWRLQAVFEGIITTKFLPPSDTAKLVGLKNKLDRLLDSGYIINQKKYDELLEWG